MSPEPLVLVGTMKLSDACITPHFVQLASGGMEWRGQREGDKDA